MNNQTQWYLQQIDLFQGIPAEKVMQLCTKLVEKDYKKNNILYAPGDENQYIFVLKKGEITLYNSHKGKKQIIEVLKPGSIFGDLNFENKSQNHFAQFTKDSFVCRFPVTDFINIIKSNPEVMIKFLKIMSDKIQYYQEKLKENLFDAKQKIVRTIERTKKKEIQNKNTILGRLFYSKTKLTHEKIAQLTGLSRETVSRAIKELKKEGIEI
jgi:CRP-like cAMP-binding protein